jgi:hypothetical protein
MAKQTVVRIGTHALTATSRATLWGGYVSTEDGLEGRTPEAATTGVRSSANTWDQLCFGSGARLTR